MQKITFVMVILITLLLADSNEIYMEDEPKAVSAVSKVMKRFNKTQDIELETQTEIGIITEDENTLLLSDTEEELDSSDMEYSESGIVDSTTIEDIEEDDNSLFKIEAHALKVIEEETQKVQEAKERALKKINEVIEQVKDAKLKSEEEF